MEGDKEIAAMQAMVAALRDLDEEARGRVLEWTAKRFQVAMREADRQGASRTVNGAGQAGLGEAQEYRDLADLLDAAGPSDGNQRALVAGYWFQVVEGGGSFSGQQINDALKETGNGLPNVTRSLDRLQRRNPSLVRQVGKSGKSRQSRKTYRLTTAGIRAVGGMVSGEGGIEGSDE